MSFIGTVWDFTKLGKKNKLPTLQEGNSIELNWSGIYNEVPVYNFSTSRVDISKLKEIYRDETVQSAIDFLTFNVMRKIGINNYNHENPAIMKLVKDSMENMDGSFSEYVRDILSKGIFYGYSVAQTVFDVVDRNYLWGWNVNYDSPDIRFNITKNDRGKEFISSVFMNTNINSYPANNFIIYQHGDLSNVYGYGRGNYAEKFFNLKVYALKMLPLYLQKFTIPTIIGTTPGNKETLFKKLLKWAINNIFVLSPEEDIKLLEKEYSAGGTKDYIDCLTLANKLIFRIFFLPALLEAGEIGGSYALGNIHFEMFDLACEQLASEFKDSVLLAQWIQKLIENNFGKQKSYGEFRLDEKKSLEDKLKMADIFLRLVNTGLIDPVIDGEWMRKDMNFPEATEEEIIKKHIEEEQGKDDTTDTTQEEESENSDQNKEVIQKS